jgi:hypothetical protein
VGKNKDKTRRQQLTYAHREIDILRELSHPNIMTVIASWDVPEQQEQAAVTGSSASPVFDSSSTIAVMALTYYKGPTVESLLQYGGALSNKFGRVVIAQVMDAVAYLHYKAVVHRDIKPDNGEFFVSTTMYGIDIQDFNSIFYMYKGLAGISHILVFFMILDLDHFCSHRHRGSFER